MTSAFCANSVRAWTLAAAISPLMFGGAVALADVAQIGNDELQALIADNVPVVDLRTPEEWRQTGVIPGSHLLTFFDARGNYNVREWMAAFSEIARPDEKVVIICAVGNRSHLVTKFLSEQFAYELLHNVQAGIYAWIQADLPVAAWPGE